MYESFYGFREKPFNLTPDPRFLYLSANHAEAFAHLEFGLKQRGGFVVVTGEVGTGKTTLCRYFLDRLDERTASAFILYPALSAVELLKSICADLGIDTPSAVSEDIWSEVQQAAGGATAKELVDALHRFLLDASAAGKNIVLVIDEAQNLAADVLEQIRLISNLETTTEKLIQIVLIGQSELNTLLGQESLRQLAQRVTARYHLMPLSREESAYYVRHRLNVAGGAGKVSFNPGALRVIHRFSKGIPRLINLVCDRALLAGFVLGRREIDARIIRRAARELRAVHGLTRVWHQSWGARAALAVLAVGALAVGFAPHAGKLSLSVWRDGGRVERADGGPPDNVEPDTATESESPNVPVPTTSAESFEMRLRTLSGDLSRRGAAGAVLDAWRVVLPGGITAPPPEEDLISIGRRSGLEVTELLSHTDQLRRLNLPAVLELFHTSRSDTCFSALIGLEGNTAVVAFSPGDSMRVPVSLLERLWVHRAYVFWKDFEGLGGLSLDDPRAIAWVQDILQGLGFLSPHERPMGTALRSSIARFQSSNFLIADGLAGPRTRLALYSLSGRYPVPHLSEP